MESYVFSLFSNVQLSNSVKVIIVLFFSGGSLADSIEKNKNSNEVMAEGELKQLLIQVAQVITSYDAMLCMALFLFL